MIKLVLLDNTVLSNFALAGRPDLILNLWGSACAITLAVLAEYQAGVTTGLLVADTWDALTTLSLDEIEASFADSLPPKLGTGERSCLAVAIHRQGLLVSDDLDARQVAHEYNIPTTGTIGVLVLNVRQGRLPLDQANALLSEMIRLGYWSPVMTLDDLLR